MKFDRVNFVDQYLDCYILFSIQVLNYIYMYFDFLDDLFENREIYFFNFFIDLENFNMIKVLCYC